MVSLIDESVLPATAAGSEARAIWSGLEAQAERHNTVCADQPFSAVRHPGMRGRCAMEFSDKPASDNESWSSGKNDRPPRMTARCDDVLNLIRGLGTFRRASRRN